MRTEHSTLQRRIGALVLVTAIVAAFALAVLQFNNTFRSTSAVTLTADRAGLVMNPDAKVRLRGVTIGRVTRISPQGDRVQLALDIDTDQLNKVPANVEAQIRSNTVFGAKSVDLALPSDPSPARLRAGSTIAADRVQVELNTVFARLVDVLAKVQPEKLNATLGAIDTALSGKGDQIGQGLDDLSKLLERTNPTLPELNRTFRATGIVTDTYADAFPDLSRLIDNLTRTGNTLADRSTNLDALLVNTTGLADTVNGIVAPKKATIMTALSNLDPVSQLLGYYSPGLACFLRATDGAGRKALPIFGETTGYLSLNAGVLPGKEPYRYPEDLPKVGVQGPPTCALGLSDINATAHAPFYVGDTAPQPYQPRTTPKADPRKLFEIMFGPVPRG
ncbi:MCE family protein [Williamsia sp. M5A3_1d]